MRCYLPPQTFIKWRTCHAFAARRTTSATSGYRTLSATRAGTTGYMHAHTRIRDQRAAPKSLIAISGLGASRSAVKGLIQPNRRFSGGHA
jgi:hypothetical protein